MRYDEQRRVCETAGGWPFPTKPAGQQYPVQGAFNPRVAGSNPARPTGRLRSSEGSFHAPWTPDKSPWPRIGPALAPHLPQTVAIGRSRW